MSSRIDRDALEGIAENISEATEALTNTEEVRVLADEITARMTAMVGSAQALETTLGFSATEADRLVRSLRLFIDDGKRGVGDASLGSANLLYLALKGLELEQLVEKGKRDHTFLAIEEPEAHLHPHVQRLVYRDFLKRRVGSSGTCWRGRYPKSYPELRLEALRFLEVHAHGEHWHIDLDEDPIEGLGDFDEAERPALYFVKKVKFDSAMSPFCKFILEYVDDPPKQLPIRVCRRSGCKRFLLPERAGRKEYCSSRCCALDHRPTPKENKDYMWLYRLNKIKTDGTLRRRLKADPNAIKRLDQIENRWNKEQKFREKIDQIRVRARL